MANFFAELKRRHIYRVGAAYAVVAWVLLQLVTNVAPVLDLPIWVARAFLLALIIGFPITLLFAWMRELAPADGTTPQAVTGRSDWVLAGGLAVIIALVSYQQLAAPRGERAVPVAPAVVEAARTTAASPANAISIAVLPFTNLSSDKEQEFFSDGMTEEITSALAKVPNLRVVGRTSAFQFKGENKDLRAIGLALSATHLIEGSVRKDGNEVRITAQLIKADDGTHLWTESYNRELKGIFAMQEDIAQAIAGALRVPLGLKPGENFVSLRPKDEETYDLFLRGRAAFRARNPESLKLLEQVIARDPNFAPGWVWYARSTVFGPTDESGRPQLFQNAVSAGRKAIALAPGYSGGYGVLATGAVITGQYLQAIELFKQALARDPDDPEVLNGYSNLLRRLGYLREALDAAERVHLLEPLIPVYNFLRAETLAANGKTETGVSEWLRGSRGVANRAFLGPAYAELGRFTEAIDDLQNWLTPGIGQRGAPTQTQLDAALQVLRAAASKTAPPARLPDFDNRALYWIYAYTPTPERMLDYFEKLLKQEGPDLRYIWWPMPSALRKTERFKTLVRDAGFVDVWRARGWPDLCRPVGDNDFTCE